ncbi:MAG: hypothetical protein RL653_1894 [Pseudomonadota bacterium]
MTLTKSSVWMAAAVFALVTTGCGPRSAKEFSGNYAVTGKSTSKRTYKSPDTGADMTEESSGDISTTVTFEAPDATTITFDLDGDGSFPAFSFKQDPTSDSFFKIEPLTLASTFGVTMKYDSGSLSFSEGKVYGNFSSTTTASVTDAEGNTQTETTIGTSSFEGPKK